MRPLLLRLFLVVVVNFGLTSALPASSATAGSSPVAYQTLSKTEPSSSSSYQPVKSGLNPNILPFAEEDLPPSLATTLAISSSSASRSSHSASSSDIDITPPTTPTETNDPLTSSSSSGSGAGSSTLTFTQSVSTLSPSTLGATPPQHNVGQGAKGSDGMTSTNKPVDDHESETTVGHEGEVVTSKPGEVGVKVSSEQPPLAEPLQNLNKTVGGGTTRLRGKCNSTDQCQGEHVECRVGICKCALGYLPSITNEDLCGEASAHHVEVPTTDPTMIGVVIGLALMSVTLCVVLRLFAKARFRENRTIFNTPNPRLMNVSLLKGSKTLLRGNSAGQRSRRGSQASQGSVEVEGGVHAVPHVGRPRPHRQLSTDTTNTESTPSSRPISAHNKAKFRQDSVASNV